jgi:hypothetical protein
VITGAQVLGGVGVFGAAWIVAEQGYYLVLGLRSREWPSTEGCMLEADRGRCLINCLGRAAGFLAAYTSPTNTRGRRALRRVPIKLARPLAGPSAPSYASPGIPRAAPGASVVRFVQTWPRCSTAWRGPVELHSTAHWARVGMGQLDPALVSRLA